MRYLFFDTAINGYYTLSCLHQTFPGGVKLIAAEEKISDDAAPFIFEIDLEKLGNLAVQPGIFLHKIMVVESEHSINLVQQHYSQFVVQEIKGKPFFFRFWAADIFQKFAATCDAEQLKEIFGRAISFTLSTDEQDRSLVFSFDGHKLQVKSLYKPLLPVEKNTAQPAVETITAATVLSAPAEPVSAAPQQEEKKPPRRFFY